MGYDSGECIICYCQKNSRNNMSNIIQLTVCHHCFRKQCPHGLKGRACCSSYTSIATKDCEICGVKNIPCLYQWYQFNY